MRIANPNGDDEAFPAVILHLSRNEAAELRNALNGLLANFGEPHWHARVADWDYTAEVTVTADRNADTLHPPPDGTWQHNMATPSDAGEEGRQ